MVLIWLLWKLCIAAYTEGSSYFKIQDVEMTCFHVCFFQVKWFLQSAVSFFIQHLGPSQVLHSSTAPFTVSLMGHMFGAAEHDTEATGARTQEGLKKNKNTI